MDKQSFISGLSSAKDAADVWNVMNQEKFARWQKRWRTLKLIGFILPFVAILAGYLLVLLVLGYISEGVITFWGIVGIIPYVVVYILYVIVWPLWVRRRLRELSLGACIHTARIGALELQSGNPVKASWYIERLLLALAEVLKQKSVTVGEKPVSPREIMVVTPDSIPRRAALRVVQENDNAEFQGMLADLEQGLRRTSESGDADAGYVAASVFLTRLRRRTEVYRQEAKTLFDRHRTLVAFARAVGPIVLSGLAAWITKL